MLKTAEIYFQICSLFFRYEYPIYIYNTYVSWSQYALPFITTMLLWQLMHLGTYEVFLIFWNIFSLFFPESNLKSKLILLLRFHHQSYIWQNSDLCNIPRKKWMMKLVCGLQINIKVFYKLMLSFWGMPKVPKIISLHIIAIS